MNQADLTVEEKIRILQGDQPWVGPPEKKGIVPDYLEQQYAREFCARSLGTLEHADVVVLAALFRAAFLDAIPEVRERCVSSLGQYIRAGTIEHLAGCSFCWSLARDESWRVRCAVLEILWEIDPEWGGKLAQLLVTDCDHVVSETARSILAAM